MRLKGRLLIVVFMVLAGMVPSIAKMSLLNEDRGLLFECPPGTQRVCVERCEIIHPGCEIGCDVAYAVCLIGRSRLGYAGIPCSFGCEKAHNACLNACPKIRICVYKEEVCKCLPARPLWQPLPAVPK